MYYTGPSVRPVPNKPANANRNIRFTDAMWRAVEQIARERGETNSDVVRRAVEEYIDRWQHGG